MADRGNTREYWDKIWSNPKRKIEKHSMNRAIWEIDKVNPKSVLDIGCGYGKTLCEIRKRYPTIELYGVDLSEVAIKKMINIHKIKGEVLDADNIDQLDSNFDFIIANHILEHIYKDKEFVTKVKDKLNSGGTFFVAVPNAISGPEETEEHVRAYNEDTLTSLMQEVFGNCKSSTIHNHLICISTKE